MKLLALYLLCILNTAIVAQSSHLPYEPFHQLDSISKSNSPSNYFGKLYYDFLARIESQLQNRDTVAQRLVRRFENVFADFFISACISSTRHEQIDLKEWEAYFADSSLQPIQYLLLGTNAHLNGGLWNALVRSFSAEEMKQLKPEFKIFRRSLNKTYRMVYMEGRSNKKLENIRIFSLGMDQWLGKYYLYKWRRRQMHIARLYWNHSNKLQTLSGKVEQKKKKIDQMILTKI